MGVVPIGSSTPQYISGTYTQKYIVKNTGASTVYLGQDSSLTVETRAFSLPSGSTLNWSGESELWGLCATGESSEIEILYTGENSFTPGPGNVTIDNAINIGANVTRLYQEVVTFDTAPQTYNEGLEGPYDVGGYSSVIATVVVLGAGDIPPVPTSYIALDVLFFDDSSGSQIAQQFSPQYMFASSPVFNNRITQSIQVPVTHRYADIRVQLNKMTTPYSGVVYLELFGSGEVVSAPKYLSQTFGMKGTLAMSGYVDVSKTTVGITKEYVSHQNDVYTLCSFKDSGAVDFASKVSCYQDGVEKAVTSIRSTTATAGGHTISSVFRAPMLPMSLQNQILTASGATATASLT